MSPDLAVQRRRALEALRAGVPNRDAVAVLGSMQVGVEDRFSQLLSALSALPEGPAAGGMMVGGGFGTGKSHVLEHLAHVALSQGFVVSKVVISKETPLHDQAKVFRSAIEQAKVPGRPGSAIDEVAAGLLDDSPPYADLYRWAHQDDAPVDSRFAATLFLHEYARGDEEFADRIVRFWAGDPLPVADLRRRLREAGAAATYRLAPIKERDLSVQRFRFVPRLMQAAGHAGWVVLLDEAELIGRYTWLQRARSYAEIARWVRGDRDDPAAPVCAVLTTVDDFEGQVLEGKNDNELVPKRLRASESAEGELLAAQAETGMRVIAREQVQLQPPGREELDRTYAQLKQIHAEAYGWAPPDVTGLERLPSNRMRQYVRAWINEWDLRRLDPSYQPELSVGGLEVDLSTDSSLEAGTGAGDEVEGDPGRAGGLGDPPEDGLAAAPGGGLG
ncbi:MAG: BREX system ATP-binding domain-containing protein [Acidimicrobiales bacterium]